MVKKMIVNCDVDENNVRILDKEGNVVWYTNPSEIFEEVPKHAALTVDDIKGLVSAGLTAEDIVKLREAGVI